MALTLADLFASPDHYLHSFDSGHARFVPMDRAAYHRSIFLDDRIEQAAPQEMRLPIGALIDRPPPRPQPTAWIFHIAHCGSTLLARALDKAGGNLVLREPLALRQAAFEPALAPLAAAMVSKRYNPALPTLVKANVPVNFLLPRLIALDPGMRAIFLHLPLRDYLLAILRDEPHRMWLRRVTGQLAPYLGALSALSDAQRAAALWLAQMRAFAAAIEQLPQARSLDAERFYADPAAILTAAAAQLGIALDAAEIAERVAGPLFATYSKNPGEAFDDAARRARRDALEPALAGEIAAADAFVAQAGAAGQEALAIVARAALPAAARP
ncbi:hypothetical protein [Sphingomonas jatrophae]|uniref:Sulfotransferase family protein n=1 Tax=Sphingomonas jatrophae TaxID=1166337 RepID=A0A1I6M765_9SPHN|nr:hypothetical protein [Sphingomonas jatrophae]SFS11501.1 hypothetical protein SAMN05192580_3592 [Sphingomonas jatrophae]